MKDVDSSLATGAALLLTSRATAQGSQLRSLGEIVSVAVGYEPAHARAEAAALSQFFKAETLKPSLHLLKPHSGHSLGASGALESLLLADFMRQGTLPPNLPGLAAPESGFALPTSSKAPSERGLVVNVSVAMGGHNAVLALAFPG